MCDNGPGIATEMLGKIGELYVTASDSGSGVGLWLTRLIIENHDSHSRLKTRKVWRIFSGDLARCLARSQCARHKR